MSGLKVRASLAQGVQSALRSLHLSSDVLQLGLGCTRTLSGGPSASLHIMHLLFSLSALSCSALHLSLAQEMLLLFIQGMHQSSQACNKHAHLAQCCFSAATRS